MYYGGLVSFLESGAGQVLILNIDKWRLREVGFVKPREYIFPKTGNAMKQPIFLLIVSILIHLLFFTDQSFAVGKEKRMTQTGPAAALSQILGRPTDRSVTLSLLSADAVEVYTEWGASLGKASDRSAMIQLQASVPAEIEIGGLKPDTRYRYRLFVKGRSQTSFRAESEHSFYTCRLPGSAFTFALQGDSHPERQGKMFDSALYTQTMRNVAMDKPDFYLTLGDDFSIERLIEQDMLTQNNVDKAYALQRGFLGLVGSSSPLFLVNGNHEQAARYLLDGTDSNAAVLAAKARNRFYPLPAPDRFYSGDARKVEHIGYLRDYYAWNWGDALFVVIDPYWHSPIAVDNKAGKGERNKDKNGDNKGGRGKRDLWQLTLGEEQYRWLTKTLGESRARWKFVFAHHVNGTGRGGIEVADQFEWGGKDKRGIDMFKEKRPNWDLPIHQLMVKSGVTIFFQGHDHLYARQELDGVVYQSTPNPADPTYQAFNKDAYRSGDVLPNSGHLRVNVSPNEVWVDYVRSFLPADEAEEVKNGAVVHSYTIRSKVK